MSATPEAGKKHSHHHSTTKDVSIPQPQFLGPQRVTKVAMKSSECPVEIVTVFKDRAEILRTVKANFPEAGEYEISISGFPSTLDPKSVHVSGGTGAAVVLEVIARPTYEPPDDTIFSELKTKTELKKELQKKQAKLNRLLDTVNKNLAWVDQWASQVQATPQFSAKKSTEASDTGFLSPAYLKNIQSFLNFRAEQQDGLSDKKADIEAQIEELNSRVLVLDAEINGYSVQAVLQLSYVVSHASWLPQYDYRVDSKSAVAQLTYYGIIKNSTGEDWNDIKLSLSTASPDVIGAPADLPTLQVQQRTYEQPRFRGRNISRSRSASRSASRSSSAGASAGSGEVFNQPPGDHKLVLAQLANPIASLVTKASESMCSAAFTIPKACTIISDNQEHKVVIAIIAMDVRFSYSVIPNATSHSYLKSTTTNPSEYFLLMAPVSVYMDNNFISKSELRKDVAPGEEFFLFLGPDKGVKVEYKHPAEIKDQSGVISKKNLQTFTGQIVVKNTKTSKIAVVLYEQLPLSSDERIKVCLIEPDIKKNKKAQINIKNIIEWRYHVEPGNVLVVPVKYSVESPKELEVAYAETPGK